MSAAAGGTAAVLVLSLINAGAANAHELHTGAAPQPLSHVVARTVASGVLVVSTLLLGGLLVAAAVMGSKARRVKWAAVVLAALAASADLVAVLAPGSSAAKDLIAWTLPLAGAHLAITSGLILSWANPTRSPAPPERRWLEGAGGAALVAVIAIPGHAKWRTSGAVPHFLIGLVHLEAAAIWVGAVLYVLLSGLAAARSHRLGTVAVGSAGLTVISGVLNLKVHLPALGVIPVTAYGRVLLVKVVVVAVVMALGLLGVTAHRWKRVGRPEIGRARRLIPGEAAAMVAVLSLAVVLAGMPGTASSWPSTSSPLSRVRISGQLLSVIIAPDRPGPNLVQVVGEDGAPPVGWFDGRSQLDFQSDDGAGEWSALTQLDAGTRTLHLVIGGRPAQLAIRVPTVVAHIIPLAETVAFDSSDRAECLSEHLGRLIALAEANQAGLGPFALGPNLDKAKGLVGACGPSAEVAVSEAKSHHVPVFGAPLGTPSTQGLTLEADPAALGSGYAAELASAGVHTLALISDPSPRSSDMDFAVQAAASREGVRVIPLALSEIPASGLSGFDAAVLTDGWADARAVLVRITGPGRSPQRGVFVAPWLLDQGLIGETLTETGTQIVVGLPLSPQSPVALKYLSALGRFAPGAVPSQAGLEGYLEALMAIDQYGDRKPLSLIDEQLDLSSALANLEGGGTLTGASMNGALQFFAPTRISFLPPTFNAGHAGHQSPSFIDNGGALAAVSGLFPLPNTSGPSST